MPGIGHGRRFDLASQVLPSSLPDLLADPSKPGCQRVMIALMGMKKLDKVKLEQAYVG